VGLCKLNVVVEVLLQPGVPLGDGAIMHVIVEMERQSRWSVRRESVGKLVNGWFAVAGMLLKLNPGICAYIGPRMCTPWNRQKAGLQKTQ